MQASISPTSSDSERIRPRRRRRVLCLVSTNPLALSELARVLARSRMQVKSWHLDLNSGSDVHEVKVPRASVYVLDASSTGAATEAVVSGMRTRRPNIRVVVVIAKASEAISFPLLHLGIKGLIEHKDVSGHLSRAVASVSDGGVWIPRVLLSRFLEQVLGRGREGRGGHSPMTKRISHRERQVLNCVLKNQSNKEIGGELNISESTVKFHLTRLFEKFGVRRRADLILQTVQQPASLIH